MVFQVSCVVSFLCTDKDFHLASERDHARATFQAHTNVSRIVSTASYRIIYTVYVSYKDGIKSWSNQAVSVYPMLIPLHILTYTCTGASHSP